VVKYNLHTTGFSHLTNVGILHKKGADSTAIRKHLNATEAISSLTYVQGLNVLAAPFLLVFSEVEAFYSFSTFIVKWCPLYAQPTMRGVHCGLRVIYAIYLIYISLFLYVFLAAHILTQIYLVT
jgi:hypothetical protein